MSIQSVFEKATGGVSRVPEDWMPASGVRSLILDDPILLWLDFYGEANGFKKDTSTYDFAEFIFKKGRQFERKWISEFAPAAVRVCSHLFDVRDANKLRQTLELIEQGAPVIVAPALWWATERIFGVPDLIVHSGWMREHLPGAQFHSDAAGVYTVLDTKFTTKLDESEKKLDLLNYAAQVRIYTYMLGQLTGSMAPRALLFCRDRLNNPLPVEIHSVVGAPLDEDLGELRSQYLTIKVDGAKYKPGINEEIDFDFGNNQDGPWHSAKEIIARELVPGGDSRLVHQIGKTQKIELARQGFPNLQALLGIEPEQIPLESCTGLGAAKCPRIRAVLRANKDNVVTRSRVLKVPPTKTLELYVDFETFNNLDVDFDREWPTLEGCEMIFMIGAAWMQESEWRYRAFIAESESRESERQMLETFETFLRSKISEQQNDISSAVLFHWTNAEVWQLRRACDRQGFGSRHILRSLPWYDLQKEVFLAEPIGVPGAFGYGLKEVVPALGLLKWPGNLDDGLSASVAGWKAYETSQPLVSEHMKIVQEYNEVDCKALYEIVRWLRRPTDG